MSIFSKPVPLPTEFTELENSLPNINKAVTNLGTVIGGIPTGKVKTGRTNPLHSN